MSSQEVELAAQQILGGEVAALVRYPEGLLPELVVQGKGLTTQAVRAGLRELLGPCKLPVDIECVAELPQTDSGKIDRRRLHDSWLPGSGPHAPARSRSSHA
jgi:acyl-coenzyme A synthetase/AMP-(fatty) acid ligase